MNIISQNYRFELKTMLKNKISSYIENLSDDLIDNLFSFNNNKYISFLATLDENIKNIIIKTIIEIINYFDEKFRNSKDRKNNYHINIKYDHRAFDTPIGYIEFYRTYYETKDRQNHFYFIDELLGFNKYSRYDVLTKAIAIDYSIKTNQKVAGEITRDKFNSIKEDFYNFSDNSIPRQTINRWIKEWNFPKIKYKPISIDGDVLYVMGDEKWIHEMIKDSTEKDDKKHYIMSKCFVVFSGIEQVKKRKILKNKFIFITSSQNPWDSFINTVSEIYDFSKINKIVFLSDAGSWLVSGFSNLKLYPNNKIIPCLCEFHVRQKVNRITTNQNDRDSLNSYIDNDNKKEFKTLINNIKESKKDNPKRVSKLEEYENYIIKNWKKIKNMAESECKSSMESHISHCVASYFSSRPKAFGRNNIETLLKLQEAKLNEINIKELYLKSYKDEKQEIYNEEELNFSLFEKSSSIIPISQSGHVDNLFKALYRLSHF